MGTSNWQNIPFCVEVMMKIAPRRVLDVGVGFGRWGMLVREFCDVWFGRIHPPAWEVDLSGIEAFPPNISEYHKQFYSRILLGDAADFLRSTTERFDLIILGDVLEHFERPVAEELLEICARQGAYVLINIPLGAEWAQEDSYGNEYERHRSVWEIQDFLSRKDFVRHRLFRDYLRRSFGTFVLSREDPRDVRGSLFSPDGTDPVDDVPPLEEADAEKLLHRVGELADEVNYIRSSSMYRRSLRLRATPLWNGIRWLRNRNRHVVTVRALGQRNPRSQGSEVWLLRARPDPGLGRIPWEFMESDGSWFHADNEQATRGRALVSPAGRIRVPVGDDPEITLLAHPYSGLVRVSFRGRHEILDLYSPTAATISVHPARTPMAVCPAAPRPVAWAGAPSEGETSGPATVAAATTAFAPAERRFIDAVRAAEARVVAVSCPRWRGVTKSTCQLFDQWYPIPSKADEDPNLLTDEQLRHQARVLAETGARHFVFSGGDEFQLRLVELLRAANPRLRCDLFWHGSYVQFSEEHVWSIIRRWIDAARKGDVYCIATTKAGQERWFHALGVRSTLLLNRVKGTPREARKIESDEHHVGLWLSGQTYRKLPHVMLSALAMMPNTRLHAAGIGRQACEVVEYLGIPTATLSESPLPTEELSDAIRRTHLTLYVTFMECCPMLPLESLMEGVPALIGPNSHLFQDNPFLFERLVVPFPDRAEFIAEYALRAIREREAIVAEYRRYHPFYDQRCEAALRAYFDM